MKVPAKMSLLGVLSLFIAKITEFTEAVKINKKNSIFSIIFLSYAKIAEFVSLLTDLGQLFEPVTKCHDFTFYLSLASATEYSNAFFEPQPTTITMRSFLTLQLPRRS